MGLDFKIRDFAYPLSILDQKSEFDRHSYLSLTELETYQLSRFKQTLSHAYEKIPYYRKLFDAHHVHPSQIAGLADSTAIPFLTKDTLSRSFGELTALDAANYRPQRLHTSGTTGAKVSFLVDRSSNVLEFVHYWRFWGWHGYRLGNRFAELSAESFLPIEENTFNYFLFNPLLNRVLINSLLLSRANLGTYLDLFKNSKPLFLKGLPSNLYVLALLCREIGNHGIRFRAIFSQGENLFPHQRELIEDVFASPLYDSYGHLERTAAISQCPFGSYHVHADYGLVQFVEPADFPVLAVPLEPGQSVAEIVGSSLHNLSMPLIRYRTGDLVILDSRQKRCACGRTFPLVHSIIGRDTDIVITPDKRAVTALYTALNRMPNLACGQIVQESIDTLVVKVVPKDKGLGDTSEAIIKVLHSFTGPAMRVLVRFCEAEELYASQGKKFKAIVSTLAKPEGAN
jgi:phenylacetate-CoA ligase